MSRPSAQESRSSFASKTAWEALGVESGEETEEEVVDTPVTSPTSTELAPPSKSALKKQKALARAEKRAQEKAARAAARANGKAANGAASPSPPETPLDSPVLVTKPLEEVKKSVQAVARPTEDLQTDDEVVQPAVRANGDARHTEKPPAAEPATQLSAKVERELPSKAETMPAAPPLVPPEAQQKPQSMAKQESKPLEKPIVSAPLEQKPSDQQDAEKVKKRQSFFTRTLWTFIMIGGFIGLLLMGHAYMIVLVFMCQMLVYREVTALFSLKRKPQDEEEANGRDPWSKTLNWYFFAVVNYYLYGETIIYYFKHVVFSDAQLTGFATNHRFISFSLYTLGFVGFVLSLKRGYLKQQFGLFCWVHMTLMLIVVSSHFIVNNILEGMIWFFVPASLVICNDVFAYIWGITVGRTPLIKLSPKKTVEGFIGAFFSTVVFGILWGTYFMQFEYMICPVRDIGASAFDGMTCTPNPVFVWRDWIIPGPLSAFLSTVFGSSITSIAYAPYQFHVLFLAVFASLVAPFGGFFASGFKRAFDIKDFGHSIPGHGGMTDRMDCQFLMGVFTYVYYSSLIRQHNVTVGSILQMIVSGLSVQEQLELMSDLKRYLEGQGIKVNL
ncbi:cytidylyltransferase family-domain-containing protein [Phanerochaete sordida]|uniref:Phosphatidate cytidylyltransferase n=1 Tax=Phanerochaete sordida TaxID=48140 RepID=A0A9P3GDG0_9APHY|nr:cytidylyltransferase family-domain-containing protein [Phanerochaete sordida]